MRKKLLAVASAMVITTLAFTGCGNSGSNSSSKDTDSKSATINVISREDGSGTRGAFVELMEVIDADKNDITVDSAEITNSTSVMLTTVAGNKNAIGYVSLGSLSTEVKAVQVDGVDATVDNIKSGTYKVSRPFNVAYKDGKLTDLDQDFINYIMSDEGQSVIDQEGYISVESGNTYTASKKKGKITIAGSTSVAPVMGVLAEDYKKLNPDVTVEIQESGSSAGIQSAIEGATEIAMSSRELEGDETKSLVAKKIAMDGIAVIVNKENGITNLTSDNIKKIYTGDVTDWADVQ